MTGYTTVLTQSTGTASAQPTACRILSTTRGYLRTPVPEVHRSRTVRSLMREYERRAVAAEWLASSRGGGPHAIVPRDPRAHLATACAGPPERRRARSFRRRRCGTERVARSPRARWCRRRAARRVAFRAARLRDVHRAASARAHRPVSLSLQLERRASRTRGPARRGTGRPAEQRARRRTARP